MPNKPFPLWTLVASALSLLIAALSYASPAFQAQAGIVMSLVALICAFPPGRRTPAIGRAISGGLALGAISTLVGVLLYGVVLASYPVGVIAGATLIGAVAGGVGGAAGRAVYRTAPAA